VRGLNPTDIAPKSMNAAVTQPGTDGMSVNKLEVHVNGDKIDYVVNGTIVHTTPKSAARTDGIYGFRVNHQLEVMVEGLAVTK
jgi:thiamine monophosphate synthase